MQARNGRRRSKSSQDIEQLARRYVKPPLPPSLRLEQVEWLLARGDAPLLWKMRFESAVRESTGKGVSEPELPITDVINRSDLALFQNGLRFRLFWDDGALRLRFNGWAIPSVRQTATSKTIPPISPIDRAGSGAPFIGLTTGMGANFPAEAVVRRRAPAVICTDARKRDCGDAVRAAERERTRATVPHRLSERHATLALGHRDRCTGRLAKLCVLRRLPSARRLRASTAIRPVGTSGPAELFLARQSAGCDKDDCATSHWANIARREHRRGNEPAGLAYQAEVATSRGGEANGLLAAPPFRARTARMSYFPVSL